MPLFAAYLLAVLVAAAMPMAAQAASFNCNIADKPDEVLICQSPELSALDDRMSSLYFHVRNRLAGSGRRLIESDQSAWLQRRFGCGRDYGCIRRLYIERISELQAEY
jgi:uncharacterized protein